MLWETTHKYDEEVTQPIPIPIVEEREMLPAIIYEELLIELQQRMKEREESDKS